MYDFQTDVGYYAAGSSLSPLVLVSNCEYTYPQWSRGRCTFKGARNLDRLHARLRDTCMIRRTKAEVLEDLPLITRSVVPLELDPDDAADYRAAEEDFLGYLAGTDPARVKRAERMAELTQMMELWRMAGRAKVRQVVQWADDFLEAGGSLLMGALHKKVTYPLVDAYPDLATLVDGDLTDVQKQAEFDRFNLDPRCRLMVANMIAGGTGWSCRATSDVAVVELPWKPSVLSQFENRVHGLERGLPGTAAHVRYFVAVGTIDEDLCRVLQTKQGWANAAVDGRDDPSGLDVHDQVRAVFRERAARRRRERVR